MSFTAIVDYGVGNLQSVANALRYLGLRAEVAGDAKTLEQADSIILPGVGAFPDAVEKLRESRLDSAITLQSKTKPVLGICLGMQLLFDRGLEVRPCKGLELVSGSVEQIRTDRKLPHIGWNSLRFQNDCPMFKGLEDGAYVYFVHSFCGVAQREADVCARTDYGGSIVAAVRRDNVYGCQFHPEKSGDVGLQMLRNFGELNR